MGTDDIILKVLFFLIIIILIMCPIKKLMEGFVNNMKLENSSRTGSKKAFNGDTIKFTLKTLSDQTESPTITIKFGDDVIINDVAMKGNGTDFTHTHTIGTNNKHFGNVSVEVKPKSGSSSKPNIGTFTIMEACSLNLDDGEENMFIGVTKIDKGKYGGQDITQFCSVDKIKDYQKQIKLYEKLLVSEKGSSKRIEYKINIATQKKFMNRCISSWRVGGSRNKDSLFKNMSTVNISDGKHICSDDKCKLFMKCPKYITQSAQNECLKDNYNGKSGQEWLYSNYNCVKKHAYREFNCNTKTSSPKYIPVSDDDCNKCRRPLSEKKDVNGGDPLIENTEGKPINSGSDHEEGVTRTERNGSLVYKCKEGYQSTCLVDKPGNEKCKGNHIILKCNSGEWEALGKCKPINCNFKEGDRTTKNVDDTKVDCVGEDGGEHAQCIDGNTITYASDNDDITAINNKNIIKKILDIEAPSGEGEEERKKRISTGYKCICGYNRDSKKDFKGFHVSSSKTRHTKNESPINKGLDDSNYEKKCRSGIYKLLKDSGKPKFISLDDKYNNKRYKGVFDICTPPIGIGKDERDICINFNKKLLNLGDKFRKDKKHSLKFICEENAPKGLGCNWKNKEHTIICEPNVKKGLIDRLQKKNNKKYAQMIGKYGKCEQVSLELLQKNKGRDLCKNRLKNREKCEVYTEINDPDTKGEKIQLCKYIGPSVDKKCNRERKTKGKGGDKSGSSGNVNKGTMKQLQIIAELLKLLSIQTKESKNYLYESKSSKKKGKRGKEKDKKDGGD